MKYFTIEIEGNEKNFRLASSDAIEIEEKYKCSVLDYIQKVCSTNCVSLLKYMSKSSDAGFSNTKANALFDELVDAGYSLQTIYMEIIYPTCVVSGIITQEDLDRIKEAIKDNKKEKSPKSDQ